MTLTELTNKWSGISPYGEGYLLVPDNHPLSFHIGYDGQGHKCFVVLNTGKTDTIVSSKAISVRCAMLAAGGYSLSFVLNYPSLDELFVKLCWDLMDSSREDADPVAKIINRYNSWLRLLQQASHSILSANEQKGLVGELLLLAEAIDNRGAETAVKAWVGPEGADQDFNFEDLWMEVKAVSIASDTVSISSIQQLDRSDKGILKVYFMDKTTSEGAQTVSLPEQIATVKGRIQSQKLNDVFDCKLAKAGFFEKDAEQYKGNRYRIAEARCYGVMDTFPRLTKSNVPTGISQAKYSISLAVLESYRIQEK